MEAFCETTESREQIHTAHSSSDAEKFDIPILIGGKGKKPKPSAPQAPRSRDSGNQRALLEAIRALAVSRKSKASHPAHRVAQRIGIHHLGHHSLAQALPTRQLAHSAYLPTFPPVPTQKVTTRIRFSVCVNAAGVAEVLFRNCVASDRDAVVYSATSSYAASTSNGFSGNSGIVAGMTGAANNSPYTAATLTAQQGLNTDGKNGMRVVSSEFECTYIGSNQSKSGQVYFLKSVDNSDISTYSTSQVIQHPHSVCFDVQRAEKMSGCMQPSSKEQMNLGEYLFPLSQPDTGAPYYDYTSASAAGGTSIGGLYFTGCPAGVTFQVLLTTHIEFCGPITSTLATPSPSDEGALQAAFQLASEVHSAQVAEPNKAREKHVETVIAESATIDATKLIAKDAPPGIANIARVGLSVEKMAFRKKKK